ncbi:MAG: DUF4377 domain-containing protein [Bacteroidota bacterium]
MKSFFFPFVATLFLLISCTNNDDTNSTVQLPSGTNLRVNYFDADCFGVVQQRCLLVQEGELLGTEEWNLFYSTIEGFTFEPGFVFNLEVQTQDVVNPPQDGSTLRYELVRVLSKVPVNCGFEDPTADLEWLRFEVEQREANITEASRYCYITQAALNGSIVFVYWDCNPVVNKVIPVYDCLGELQGFIGDEINLEDLENQKIVWMPDIFACEPNL